MSLFSTIVDTGGGPDLPEATRGDRAGRDSFRYSTRDTRICIFSSFFSLLFLVGDDDRVDFALVRDAKLMK